MRCSAARQRRPGQTPLPTAQRDAVARLTASPAPAGCNRWTSREVAAQLGMSKSSVLRIWREHGMAPHRRTTYKMTNDPLAPEKLRAIGGLYLDPPVSTIVLCIDEKTQIQALERPQPPRPVGPGQLPAITPDNIRHGVTNLFAALRVHDGYVYPMTARERTAANLIVFMEQIEAGVPARLQICTVMDNLSTHTTPAVRDWLQAHPRWTVHFTAKYASWMNGAETVFAHYRKNCYDGYSAPSLEALEEHSLAYFERYNELWKQPFVWRTDPEDILRAMRRGFMKVGMPVPWETVDKPTAKCMG